MREKFEMHLCVDGECRILGRTTNEERAKRRVAREVRKLEKKRLRGKTPSGTVKGSVTDAGGLVRYRAHAEYGPPEPRAARPRRPRVPRDLPPLEE
jgi:hypothetical protein